MRFRVSAAMGTVELTGLEIMFSTACSTAAHQQQHNKHHNSTSVTVRELANPDGIYPALQLSAIKRTMMCVV
jgi:hypothetical protein